VVFFNRSYWPDQAATGQLLTELAEDLVRHHQCQVSVVAGVPLHGAQSGTATSRGWSVMQRESQNGVQILRAVGTCFSPRKFIARATNYLSYFAAAGIAGFRTQRPDVVVALTDPPIIGLLALLLARRWRVKFVLLCQDVFPEVARLLEDFHSETVDTLLTQVNRFLIRQADGVIAVGETMRERLITGKGAAPQKVTVIHNWTDCSAIVPGCKTNPFALEHGLHEAFVVMHSGNIGLSQSLETVVQAAERLQSVPDLQIIFVGDGVKKSRLEAQVRQRSLTNVRFLPYVARARLSESYATADVFLVSLKPGLAGYIVPSKLYGILAAGRPYVAAVETDCEVATITNRHDCGLLAAPQDPNDLAEKILALYRDQTLAKRLGTNARAAALQFDRSPQVGKYYALFRQLTNT
jgi:colanic acid biosynthesis glycosyl transferase WcaI